MPVPAWERVAPAMPSTRTHRIMTPLPLLAGQAQPYRAANGGRQRAEFTQYPERQRSGIPGRGMEVGRGQAGGEESLPAALLLLWIATLLLPTLLSEDTPHFLRAVGVLPAICLVAAVGLDWLWEARRLPVPVRRGLVVLALLTGGLLTTRDYFARYAVAPDTGYLFQSAATTLASQIQASAAEGVTVYADQRYRDQFASVRFLAGEVPGVIWYDAVGPLQPAVAAAPARV